MNTIQFDSNGILAGYSSYGRWDSGKLIVFNSRIIDFVIYDNLGKMILVPLRYIEADDSTEVDLTDFIISGIWTAKKAVVQPGIPAGQPVSASEFIILNYAMNVKGNYSPIRKIFRPIPIENIQDIPLIGTKFYASGIEQLVNGRQIVAIIPASGENRQYIGTARVSRDCLHHFQVFSSSQMILEAILDYQDFPAGSVNLGQTYYFPENLPAYDPETHLRKEYNWRARISYKQEDVSSNEEWPNNLIWSEWSRFFTFKVNVPPGAPTELSVRV